MLRVCVVAWILPVAACISYPEVTTVDETHDASVSPDGSAERIALVEPFDLDAGDAASEARDGGVLPHPEGDAGAGAAHDDGDGGDDGDDPGKGKGKGKGKPPKKKD